MCRVMGFLSEKTNRMSTEFLEGVIRLTVPLFTASFAAFFYQRVGLVNLAIDGEIALAAIGYVIGSQMGSALMGVTIAVLFAGVIGGALVYFKESRHYDQFLVGLSLLYISYGLSRSLCGVISGNPQYAYLSEHRLGDQTAIIALTVAALSVFVTLLTYRALRLASISGSARDLAAIQGINVAGWGHLHSVIAALLIALTGVYLVEHGGSFTAQISGQRGFLALAVVAISGRSIIVLVFWSVVFAVSQKFLYTFNRFPGELVEAAPYCFTIVVLVVKHGFVEYIRRHQSPVGTNPLQQTEPELV